MTEDDEWRFTGWTGRSNDPNDEQFGDVVEETSLDDADACDVVLLGEPFDGAVLGRPGARYGPGAIRTALADLKTARLDGETVGSVGDLGDERASSVVHFHATEGVADLQERLCDVTADVHGLDAFPVFLGGDNSVTYANVEPLLDRGVGVVNFDAHLDVREVRSAPTSGTPYRQLLEAGLDGYAVVGARHFETAAPYVEYVREQGGEIVGSDAVAADPEGAVDRAVDALGDVDHVYVSVDLDVLDATAAPGVSAPTPGGVTTGALFRMLRHVAGDPRVAGFEVVECAPPLDRDGRTVAAAARAVAQFLGGREATGDHA